MNVKNLAWSFIAALVAAPITVNAQHYTAIDLGTVDVYGINASGQVTGTLNIGDQYHAFVTNAATNAMIDLGSLGGGYSEGYGINARGQVTGYDGEYGNPSHAFITNATTNAMSDLGTLGGTVSAGYGINDSGQVTGYSYTAGNLFIHAFITNAATHAMTDLGTLGGTESEGSGINASGEVTGNSTTAGDASSHGFLYSNGHMLDLNSLLSPTQAALYTITSGRSINDSGQIAAVGYLNATSHGRAFLLTSVAVFSCHGFLPPFDGSLALNQNNPAIPLKAKLFDSNNLLVDPAVLAALDAAPPVVNVSYRSGASPLADETSLVESRGQSGTGYQFNFDRTTGNWWFNLSSGLYTAFRHLYGNSAIGRRHKVSGIAAMLGHFH